MDLEGSPPRKPEAEASGAAACSICLDPVLGRGGGRSVAKLQCGHEFHLGQIPSRPCLVALSEPDLCGTVALIAELNMFLLLDCIGSAFNAKGAMQCPNCRMIEKGRWLYASGHRPSPDIDMGGWVTGETYDITSDLPFGFQWCPFSGFTQLASVYEEREAEPTAYHTVGQALAQW
ncbi:hypothetical protein PR202_gb02516 [Eleusine coracana subsp. coracana]|uniref:RING-type domain-containing protein n=1 Tax=Eleusine coracana subsp. coracana TaxID=191504 RepID=A0AAV5DYP5_ELECO|nr:hypothetical protein PR202_gb02516 [Eleusine coracana subsp. coracana]